MKLKDYIRDHYYTKRDFAADIGVMPQQVTAWIKKEFIVIDGVMYSPRRSLKDIKELMEGLK